MNTVTNLPTSRGSKHIHLALAFYNTFPDFKMGLKFTAEQFEEWADTNLTERDGWVRTPVKVTKTIKEVPEHNRRFYRQRSDRSWHLDSQSDLWWAHLQRRHNLRWNINKAAGQPRLMDEGALPFTIDTEKKGEFRINSPQDSVLRGELPKKVASLTENKKKRLDRLMQSADWLAMQPWQRVFVKQIHKDIEQFAKRVLSDSSYIVGKIEAIRAELKLAVEQSKLIPQNGAIREFIDDDDERTEE